MQFLKDRDIAIVSVADTPHVRRGGRTALSLAGAVLEDLLADSGIEKASIDGLCVATPMSEAGNPFWANMVADGLGLRLSFAQVNQMGGCSAVANVARAALAIKSGLCETVLCLAADAVTTADRSLQTGYRVDYADPVGYSGPTVAFGLIGTAYEQRHGSVQAALAKIAVTQRAAALSNPITCDVLNKPLSEEDYLASRMIATPVRLLDCVIRCDGANGLLVMTTARARALGLTDIVHPVAYREITNIDPLYSSDDILRSGFEAIGPTLFADAGIAPADIRMLQLYDDFTIAILLQLEHLGFAPAGQGASVMLERDMSAKGDLPINTGGGQLSCGQPGLASGGVNLSEALKQLLGRAGPRQMPNAVNALVTGIGGIEYARNWSSSAAMILERGA